MGIHGNIMDATEERSSRYRTQMSLVPKEKLKKESSSLSEDAYEVQDKGAILYQSHNGEVAVFTREKRALLFKHTMKTCTHIIKGEVSEIKYALCSQRDHNYGLQHKKKSPFSQTAASPML